MKNKINKKRYKSIVYVTPMQLKNMGNLRSYLIENTQDLITYHFYNGYSDEKSYMEKFHNGRIDLRIEFPAFKPKVNIIRLILYRIYFEYILIRYVKRGSFVIVEKPFFLIFSVLISFIKNLEFIFWIGDYYPEKRGFMKIYNMLADYYNKNLKIVLYVSPPIKKIYEKKDKKSKLYGKIRLLLSLGTKKKGSQLNKEPHHPVRVGYIGMLKDKKGLDLVFSYLQRYDNAVFEVIGEGYKLDYYKRLAKKLKIDKKVKFYGYVDNVDKIINKWDIGVALYENKKTSNTIYCEPTKIKNYLEYGLPVITTKATYLHKHLEREEAGVAIEETPEAVYAAILKITSRYKEFRKGTERIVDQYEYKKYYDSLLNFMRE